MAETLITVRAPDADPTVIVLSAADALAVDAPVEIVVTIFTPQDSDPNWLVIESPVVTTPVLLIIVTTPDANPNVIVLNLPDVLPEQPVGTGQHRGFFIVFG